MILQSAQKWNKGRNRKNESTKKNTNNFTNNFISSNLIWRNLYPKTKFVENILPEYKLGPDFTGLRNIGLKVSDATKDIYYDLDGNVVDEEGKIQLKRGIC